MSSPASFKGHPFHPIIIPLPIGLWIFSLVSDLIFKLGYGGPVWNAVAFYTLGGGIVGAFIAAVPGFVDLTGLTNPQVDRHLAYDYQSSRRRSLLLQFVAAYAARTGRQPSDYTFCHRRRFDHYLRLARWRIGLRARGRGKTAARSKYLTGTIRYDYRSSLP
jgi:hypothetical protein